MKLGPFKFEYHHQDPEIGRLHDFASQDQVDKILNLIQGKTISTPYFVGGSQKSYSKERTSKVGYLNETFVPEAMVISKNIELATRFKIISKLFASENYQVMNYGLGGKIDPHVDSLGQIFGSYVKDFNDIQDSYFENSAESSNYGGLRILTFMLYLSTVDAGGHTIFPQTGISIKPELGSVLFWFNIGARNNHDSRIRHLGCPVLYGNKWIANKWIKWLSNFNTYPCLIRNDHYSINKKCM